MVKSKYSDHITGFITIWYETMPLDQIASLSLGE